MKLCILVLILQLCSHLQAEEKDYYQLLGVNRDATVKEIRKAFKVLAVKLHPDKNKDDKNTDQVFMKITRAYEVLKDPHTRKNYDLHGDTSDSDKKQEYHSYSYYTDHFGIYDDDPIIVTLSRHDYVWNVLDDNQAWFVNFYAPSCHHCHTLAPTWRKLARELEGVIRIAAVNCEDDYVLCTQLKIRAYPTLMYYEKESHLFEGQIFRGDRTFKSLEEFVLSKLQVPIKEITSKDWNKFDFDKEQWLLFLCGSGNVNCPERKTMLKLAAPLEGLISVGIVVENKLCEKISADYKNRPVVFWQVKKDKVAVHNIHEEDTKEILEYLLNKLPNPESIDADEFKEIRSNLRDTSQTRKPWLFCFYLGTATQLNLQLKRLPTLIPHINIGLIHCGKNAALCSTLHVVRYPMWGILKVGGAFELHHGRDVLHDLADFARDGVKAVNLHALSPADFYNLKEEGSPWLVDWYAPWCPPCRKLMPEFRKASQEFDADTLKFGTIDCSLHRNLCLQEGIDSYPTIILYNNSHSEMYHNVPNAEGIIEFVKDMIKPSVLFLNEDNFLQLLRKPVDEIWVVNYESPRCGVCQKFAGKWRSFTKEMLQFPEVKVAQINCLAYDKLCNTQDIRRYPTIRLYPQESKGINNYVTYQGSWNDMYLKRWVMGFLPTPVAAFTAKEFEENVLTKRYFLPWLINFQSSSRQESIQFEADFRIIAQKLEGRVRTAKIDCEVERIYCGSKLGLSSFPAVRLYTSPKQFYIIYIAEVGKILKKVKEILDENQRSHDEL